MTTTRDKYLANQDKEQQREDRITNRREYMYQNPSDFTICVIDTETSGLRAGVHEILSMCIMPLTDKFERMGNPFNVRIKAVNPCEAKALAVNKLDPTIGFTKAEAWEKLKAWKKSAMIEKVVPLGHNPHFDLPFILMLSGNPEEFRNMFHYHNRDTMAMAQIINDLRTINNLPKMFNSLSLSKVATALNLDTTFAHTAEGDCELTRLVFKRMLNILALK